MKLHISTMTSYRALHNFAKGIKTKNPLVRVGFVVPPGIEPGTHGFSVHCSTI